MILMARPDGAFLAGLYAYPPNSLGYCGKDTFKAILKEYLDGDHGIRIRSAMERQLRDFSSHFAYLRLIATENGLEPFDDEVVRAFWIGNRLLKNINADALRSFLEDDLLKGKSASRVRRLCDRLPEGILPHHSFNSLYVNFVTDKVDRSIRNFDSCLISAGTVTAISPDGKWLEADRFCIKDGRGEGRGFFVLGKKKERIALVKGGLRLVKDDLLIGDTVSIHWNQAVERIQKQDLDSLIKYTRLNIDSINKAALSNGLGCDGAGLKRRIGKEAAAWKA